MYTPWLKRVPHDVTWFPLTCLSPSSSYLLLHNKSPTTSWFKTAPFILLTNLRFQQVQWRRLVSAPLSASWGRGKASAGSSEGPSHVWGFTPATGWDLSWDRGHSPYTWLLHLTSGLPPSMATDSERERPKTRQKL